MTHLDEPLRAAEDVARRAGIGPDRGEVLQDGHTLVVQLTEDLVARVVTDREGPRQGAAWFEREIAVAKFLAERGAPMVPVHTAIDPGPHEHGGYVMNFWKFV